MQTTHGKILTAALFLTILAPSIAFAAPGDSQHRRYYTEMNMVVALQDSLLKANELQKPLVEADILEIETGDGYKLQASISKWSAQADEGFLPGDMIETISRRHKTDYSFRVIDHVFRLVHDLPYNPIFIGLNINEIFRANYEVMEALEEFKLNRLKPKVIERLVSEISKGYHWPQYLKNPLSLALLMIFAERWDPNGQLARMGNERFQSMTPEEANALVLHLTFGS